MSKEIKPFTADWWCEMATIGIDNSCYGAYDDLVKYCIKRYAKAYHRERLQEELRFAYFTGYSHGQEDAGEI